MLACLLAWELKCFSVGDLRKVVSGSHVGVFFSFFVFPTPIYLLCNMSLFCGLVLICFCCCMVQSSVSPVERVESGCLYRRVTGFVE